MLAASGVGIGWWSWNRSAPVVVVPHDLQEIDLRVDELDGALAEVRAGLTDEFITPKSVVVHGEPLGMIRDGDVVLWFNFRADRARQFCRALTLPDFDDFTRGKQVNVTLVTMTHYADEIPATVAYLPVPLRNVLGQWLGARGHAQFRTAETEKYAHVTYFFNGGVEKPFAGEERGLVKSPRVDTYDQQPEMSAAMVADGVGVIDDERFRMVMEGPPPYPYYRNFRNLFEAWGAVAVQSTYSTVGGTWEFGFRHDPRKPLESIADQMIVHNLCNRSMIERYKQIRTYVDDWHADALVIHSVKSCRLFSAGQGDMREYFTKELGVPTLMVESDLEDPRYYAEAQMKNRIDAFFEALQYKRLRRGKAG